VAGVAPGTYSSEPGDDTSQWGGSSTHAGVDIPAPEGDSVYPVVPGRVITADTDPRGGIRVIVQGEDGNTYIYGHLQSLSVQQGMEVGGTRYPIGKVGHTGVASGPHLHLEVHDANGNLVDPRPLFAGGAPSVAPATARQQAEAPPAHTPSAAPVPQGPSAPMPFGLPPIVPSTPVLGGIMRPGGARWGP
jgi:murein DD-endopeptidase MepM/ murein hydrolase activator NlpD